jgi:hypothetical protein
MAKDTKTGDSHSTVKTTDKKGNQTGRIVGTVVVDGKIVADSTQSGGVQQ